MSYYSFLARDDEEQMLKFIILAGGEHCFSVMSLAIFKTGTECTTMLEIDSKNDQVIATAKEM